MCYLIQNTTVYVNRYVSVWDILYRRLYCILCVLSVRCIIGFDVGSLVWERIAKKAMRVPWLLRDFDGAIISLSRLCAKQGTHVVSSFPPRIILTPVYLGFFVSRRPIRIDNNRKSRHECHKTTGLSPSAPRTAHPRRRRRRPPALWIIAFNQ